jgi:hypothetical protein
LKYGIYGLSLTNIYNFAERGITMKPILILLLIIVVATTTLLTTTPIQVQATTGMSGEPHGGGQDNPQPDRVGAGDDNEDDVQDTPRDGPGGDDATGDDTGEENCWGKVTSDAARTFEPGEFGSHASDPVQRPGDTDNETPREGVGNQQEGHPSDHADGVGSAFDSDDTETCDND